MTTSPPDVERWNAARSNRAIDGARYALVTFGALSFDAWPPTCGNNGAARVACRVSKSGGRVSRYLGT